MKAVIISPHPDDETLGACGTAMKLISQGNEVVWLNVTNMKEEYGYSAQAVFRRSQEIQCVQRETGYHAFFDLGLRPAALEQYEKADIILRMKDVLEKIRPEIVFLPFSGDVHSDHRIVYDCAAACTKPFRAPYVRRIMCMDILSETNYASEPFPVNCYVDISAFIEKKLQIAAIYQSEFQESPFPRSKEAVLAQAQYRGSACFCKYAEAFQLVKEIYI